MSAGPWANFCRAIASDAFLAAQLVSEPIRDDRQERQLTALRRRVLFSPAPLELLAHLAIQCFLNEFAWNVEEDEARQVQALRDSDDPAARLRVACYEPLTFAMGGAVPVSAVERVQVLDAEHERRLAPSIPVLTEISEGVSRDVQAMYEESPYPRWNLLSDPPPLGGAADILIAGCGTGRHALNTAKRRPHARVLAVDLSRASLAYGMRKGLEAGVANVEWAQADILRLPDLGRDFDQIECAGTLHHMEDPEEGLAALVACLRPGGRLRLGLYSEAGRRPLRAAQVAGKTVTPTPEGIRAFRHRIMSAPELDPLRGALTFPDFFATSNCRDLLLNVKEHQHTMPQIADMLRATGLRFEGFDLAGGVKDRFREAYGDELDLSQWAAFEERHPDTFRRMYQFWASKPA